MAETGSGLAGPTEAAAVSVPPVAAPAPSPESEAPAAEPAPLSAEQARSQYDRLPTTPRRVVAVALDVLTRTSGDLRRASFYIGLIVLGLVTPAAMVFWRFAIDPAPDLPTAVMPGWTVALFIAFGGLIVASVESRAVAVSVLAAALADRPIALRDAVQRSRTVFWRLVRALILTIVPLALVQEALAAASAQVLGGESEPSVVTAAIATAVLFSPFAYVVTGVVLGDVGAWTAVKRSLRLFRARKLTGVVVALFDFGSQLLTSIGLAAGLDLVVRGAEATGLSPADPAAAPAMAALVVILLFAVGTLVFTVAAISIAPQVVAFLGLTHVSPGLERVGGEGTRYRWLTLPMLGAMVVGALAMFAGLAGFD